MSIHLARLTGGPLHGREIQYDGPPESVDIWPTSKRGYTYRPGDTIGECEDYPVIEYRYVKTLTHRAPAPEDQA